MTQTNDAGAAAPIARARYLGFLKLALAIFAVFLAVGYLPTERLAGESGLTAMVAGCGVSLVGSVAGTLPFLLSGSRTQTETLPAVMGSIALRLAVVIALATGVAWSGAFAVKPLLVWVAISHAGLLVADTRYARAEVMSRSRATKVGGRA